MKFQMNIFICLKTGLKKLILVTNELFHGVSTFHILHMNYFDFYKPGPTWPKLTMLLVNILLKIWTLNMAYMLIFLLKKKM